MKYKSLAVLGLLLMAAPVQSFAAVAVQTDKTVINKGVTVPPGQLYSQVWNLIAGSYTFDLSAVAKGKASGSVTATLINAAQSTVVSLFTSVDGKNSSNTSSLPFLLSAGQYRVMWSGVSDAGSKGTIHAEANLFRLSANQPVPVPGPEAGAGLGALAMAGVAYLVTRRRKVSVAA